jgi:hypothetical protein
MQAIEAITMREMDNEPRTLAVEADKTRYRTRVYTYYGDRGIFMVKKWCYRDGIRMHKGCRQFPERMVTVEGRLHFPRNAYIIMSDHDYHDTGVCRCLELNGNNGSWTGSDDVDFTDGLKAMEGLRRMERERVRDCGKILTCSILGGIEREIKKVEAAKARRVHAHRNYAFPENLRADPNDMSQRPAGIPKKKNDNNKIRDENRFNVLEVEPDLKDDEPEEPSTLVVIGDGKMGWDGSQVCDLIDGQFVAKDGTIYGSIDAGVRIQAKKYGIGYVKTPGNVEVVTRPAFDSVHVPELSTRFSSILKADYMVFWPLHKELSTKFPGTSIKEHTINACMALYERTYRRVGVPTDVGMSTVQYFIHQKRRMEQELVKLTPGYVPADHELENPHQCHSVGVCVNHGALTVRNGVTYADACSYDPCNHFHVGIRGGIVDFNRGIYPQFDTPTDDAIHYKRSVMFSLNGIETKPFVIYDVNGRNACAALKRPLAERDRDTQYTYCQYRFGASLVSDSYTSTGLGQYRPLGPIRVSDKIVKEMRVKFKSGHIVVGNERHSHSVSCVSHMTESYICAAFPGIPQSCTRELITDILPYSVQNQKDLVRRHHRDILTHTIESCHNATRWAYYTVYDKYLTTLEPIIARQYNAKIPHVKKKLRTRYVDGERIHDTDNLMVTTLAGCVKKEFAKFGKVPRLFASYGAGSMYANELPEYSKKALDGEHVTILPTKHGDLTVVCRVIGKPKPDVFDECFSKIREAVTMHNYMYVVVYSDDAVYAGNILGKPLLKNVDISSCDAGQRWPVFLAMYECLAVHCPLLALGLVKQCCLPMEVKNPSNRDESLTINFDGPYLGSGTVLTTILNSMSGLKNAQAVGLVLSRCMDADVVPFDECIELGATLMGHKVSIEDCCDVSGHTIFEKVQLLKRSMFRTMDGDWTHCINFGTITRGLGTIEGDMKPEQLGLAAARFRMVSWQDRMDMFVSTVIQGLCHEPSNPIIDALRLRFNTAPDIQTSAQQQLVEQHYIVGLGQESDRSTKTIDPTSLCARYDCDIFDLNRLADKISGLSFGWEYCDPLIDAFNAVDYGAPYAHGT